jgi:hypothetical protein
VTNLGRRRAGRRQEAGGLGGGGAVGFGGRGSI